VREFKLLRADYKLVGKGQIEIYWRYRGNMDCNCGFIADPLTGPYTYSVLQGIVDSYAGALARNGYSQGLVEDLGVWRGALDYLREHTMIGDMV
jgi:hypothetical protein